MCSVVLSLLKDNINDDCDTQSEHSEDISSSSEDFYDNNSENNGSEDSVNYDEWLFICILDYV